MKTTDIGFERFPEDFHADVKTAFIKDSTTLECVNTIYKGDVQILHYCPHCGESYYMEKCRTRTAMYYPPIYKGGVNINPDRNTTTVHCTCMNCKNDFSFTE